jgi:AcrR family transcriptional regulator
MFLCSPTNACLPVSESTAARRRSPRGRGAELRREVLQAAMDLLAETADESAVSVRAVAQRVGVSVPSIYLHFADKQDLMDAACGEVFEALHQRLRTAGEAADDPVSALCAQGRAYVHFALENREHYRVVMMQLHDTAQGSMATVGAGFQYLVDGVAACVEAGVFEGDPFELALGLWTAAHGVASLMLAKPFLPWPDADEFIDRSIWQAGVGLAAAARLDRSQSVPELVERLDALRS